jgi:hypothetical protein
MKPKNISGLKKPVKYSKLPSEPLKTGSPLVNYNVLELKEVTEDSYGMISSPKQIQEIQTLKHSIVENPISTVESLLLRKKRIWKDKLNISEINTLILKLSKILDLESTSKEKDLTPLSIPLSKEISKHLWLPTEIDCVDSVLSLSRESLRNSLMGKSWFSIQKKHPQKKNSLMTSFQSSQFSLPESMDSVHTPSKRKSKKRQTQSLKTLKIRLFPTEEEKEQLQVMFNQFKWYYNITLTATHNYYKNRLTEPLDYSHISIRNLLRKYEVTEEKFLHLTFQDLIYREDRNEFPKPSYWDHVYDRVIRGSIEKYVMALNSALSNYKNGNIKKFKMRYLGKKNPFNILYFEDKGFPAFIRKIKSNYWFTNRNGKKSRISFTDIDMKKRQINTFFTILFQQIGIQKKIDVVIAKRGILLKITES